MNTAARTAAEAGAFLDALAQTELRPYQARAPFAQQAVRELLARVGKPQQHLRVIHIAGSKGKGSTALLAEAILRAAGRRTGTFTSPHLQRWTERFRINGREVAESELATAIERLRPPIVALAAENPANTPSFFDAATAAALLLFRQAGVDYAIIETGLGGRLDATNVVDPKITCITSIELEHTDKLGDTLEAIAWEKAGIIKPGIPVVTGALPNPAASVIAARAKALGAPRVQLHEALRVQVESSGIHGFVMQLELGDLRIDNVYLPLLGGHTVHNAALAVACIFLLKALTPGQLAEAVRQGFATMRLPGRLEILHREPWVLVDAAHTAVSAQALLAVLERVPARRAQLVLSVSSASALKALCANLLADFEAVTVTAAEPTRSLPAEKLAQALRDAHPDLPIRVVTNPRYAVLSAYESLTPDALLCVTGSVYMAGVARAMFVAEKIKPFVNPGGQTRKYLTRDE